MDNQSSIEHVKGMAENMKEENQQDFAMLSVVVSELNRLL